MYQLGVAPNSFVLDLNMPRVDGWTVLLKIRASDVLQKIPVVVLSTSAEPEDQLRALLLGGTPVRRQAARLRRFGSGREMDLRQLLTFTRLMRDFFRFK
jgi:CheY-like chemotaxis protein